MGRIHDGIETRSVLHRVLLDVDGVVIRRGGNESCVDRGSHRVCSNRKDRSARCLDHQDLRHSFDSLGSRLIASVKESNKKPGQQSANFF